ncbi:MAG: ATP-binding protein [Anaerolineales bacterium]|nr:ATP-binding protein [Anaerolineales bacterium]
MEDFEKLGVFYLGRSYNLKEKKSQEELLLYDSKDLVTHAVCVGMTGSGKTGLCLGLIEEAAIDGVPVILIDPKGDLGNLLLTFPQLRGEDFLPWINQDDARQKGLSPEEYAQKQAELWQKGLAGWGQSGERIQRLRDAADFVIYTPGSNAGIPVSILKSFAAPAPAVIEDNELMRDRVSATATSLLGLIGIEADPIQSREHILLSTILDTAWRQGQDLDLAALISQVQTPPVTKIGVLDLETFYSAKDRFGLVMALNNLLASPGFNTWLEGEALDVGQILYTSAGKPRIAIFSIAHLSDSERMFFVSLLLNQILAWTRSQSGTTSLRALVYMDEIFGYLPPTSSPPSKLPMLTLLKQARAFGVGIVLATQNPVDLDYKALANTGTWFIGRLQTERDKARLLEGLEGAAASTGSGFDRQAMEQTLAGLGSRVFLMNNVHEDAPVIFETRWVLSYLRGPLTRDQIKVLMDPRKAAFAPARAASATPAPTMAAAPAPVSARTSQPPALPPDVPRYFIPRRGSGPGDSTLVYQPQLLGVAKVRFADAKTKVELSREVVCLTSITHEVVPVNWENSQAVELAVSDLENSPEGDARYADLPSLAGQSKSYAAWNRDLIGWLYQSQALELLKSPSLGLVSQPGEEERDFRVRLQQTAREQRDEAVEQLRKKYAPKIANMQERLRKAEQRVEKEKTQASQAGLQTVFSIGATLLGAFTGRKVISSSTISKVSSAARKAGQAMEQSKDVGQATETVEAIQQQLAELEAQFNEETAALEAKLDPQTEPFETVAIKPKKTDISVQLVALAWAPCWQDSQGQVTPAWS